MERREGRLDILTNRKLNNMQKQISNLGRIDTPAIFRQSHNISMRRQRYTRLYIYTHRLSHDQ